MRTQMRNAARWFDRHPDIALYGASAVVFLAALFTIFVICATWGI